MPTTVQEEEVPGAFHAAARLRQREMREEAARFVGSVTALLMIVHLAVFIYTSRIGGFVDPKQNNLLGPGACDLLRAGAKFSPLMESQAYRIFTSFFIHGGVLTLLVTFCLQVSIMFPFELENGRMITLFVFLACNLCGCGLSMIGAPLAVSTGPLAGLMGMVAYGITKRILNSNVGRKITLIDLAAVVSTVMLGQSELVDNYASLAGFALGAFVGGMLSAHQVADDDIPFLRVLLLAVSFMSASFIAFICFFLSFGSTYRPMTQMLLSYVCATQPDHVPFY